jgi:hypothetical protein
MLSLRTRPTKPNRTERKTQAAQCCSRAMQNGHTAVHGQLTHLMIVVAFVTERNGRHGPHVCSKHHQGVNLLLRLRVWHEDHTSVPLGGSRACNNEHKNESHARVDFSLNCVSGMMISHRCLGNQNSINKLHERNTRAM